MEQCDVNKVVFVMDDATKSSACCYSNSTLDHSATYFVDAKECIHIYDPKVCEQMLSNEKIQVKK